MATQTNGDIHFKFEFIPQGATVSALSQYPSSRPSKNKIFLDVGNDLTKGIIDHHQIEIDRILQTEDNTKIFKCVTGLVAMHKNYILDNISDDAKEVTIVVHENPDFDCFASAYLVKYLIENRDNPELPLHYEKIIEYAEKVDTGQMKLVGDNYKTPFAIACAIGEDREFHNSAEKHNYIMDKGLELIKYMIGKLEKERHISLYESGFIYENSYFKEELEFLKHDKEKYKEDIKNSSTFQIKLQKCNDENSLVKVDAIAFNRIPQCILHKYWARSDFNSPSKKGYILTIIPSEPTKIEDRKNLSDNDIKEYNKIFKSKNIELTSTIISVQPYSNVCIKKLGKNLELAELKKENKVFENDDLIKKWRRRGIEKEYRYSEEWCINGDPWYDGRGHEYTIVDSPHTNSLLTIDEIINIVIDSTKPVVEKSKFRFIFPFYYKNGKFDKLTDVLVKSVFYEKIILNRNNYERNFFSTERMNYFIPYVQEYLYSNDCIESKNKASAHFKIKREAYIKLDKDYKFNGISQNKDEGNYKVMTPYISLFRYGVGFIIFDIDINAVEEKDLLFKNVLTLNETICEEYKKIGYYFLENLKTRKIFKSKDLILEFDKGIIYEALIIKASTFYESERKEMTYKLCNILKVDDNYFDCPYIHRITGNMILSFGEHASYGFSKNGQVLLLTNNGKDYRVKREIKKLYGEDFFGIHFDIFLLALQQRLTLLRFSNELIVCEKKDYKKGISSLRANLIDCITQGWFSQITNNELGMELYKAFNRNFENEILYEEVSEQVKALDEYNESKFTKKMNVVSAVFFPILTISAMFEMGIIKINPLINGASEWNWGFVLLIWILFARLIYKFR